jgi:dolichol-phosphate mannosyltransferase
MNPSRPLISVVCPAYQEEEVLPLFHAELGAVLASLKEQYRFEIIFVDDGSSDGTLACLRHLGQADPRVRYLSLSRNFGHQAALTAGLEHARGDAVISMDSDLQHPPRVLPALLDRWRAGHDVVITIRQEDTHLHWFKRHSSRLFYRAMKWVGATEVRPAAADFRLLSKAALSAFLRLRERHRFVRAMVQWLGFTAAEVCFKPGPRRAGCTKYTLSRMIRLAGDGLFSFSNFPLRLPLYAGLIAWTLGFFQLAGCLSYLALGGEGLNFTLQYLIFLGHLLGGGVLVGLGTIGEYLGRVFDEVKRRPLYLVKESNLTEGEGLNRTAWRDAAEAFGQRVKRGSPPAYAGGSLGRGSLGKGSP